jgi:hypothetical protein
VAIALIAASSAVAQADDNPTTAALDTTGANLLVIVATNHTSGSAPSGVSDSKGNNVGSNVGSGHTFTLGGTFVLGAVAALAFSGAHATAPFDVEAAGNSTGSGTTVQPGSVTPSQDDSLIIQAVGIATDGTGSLSIDGGYATAVWVGSGANTANRGMGFSYLIQTTAAATNPTWTNNANNSMTAVAAAFKPAAGGGGDVTPAPGVGALSLTGTTGRLGFTINLPDEA